MGSQNTLSSHLQSEKDNDIKMVVLITLKHRPGTLDSWLGDFPLPSWSTDTLLE
jgi:hypothetical protein